MDEITKFEALFRRQFVSEINYFNDTFSFRTVCMQNHYSYRMCKCAFEHEYIDYFSNTGEIDNASFENIKRSISQGECPHVGNVDKKCIKITKIHAMHIAFVVGAENIVGEILSEAQIRVLAIADEFSCCTGIFRNSPYQLALMRERYNIIELFYGFVSRLQMKYYGKRSHMRPHSIFHEAVSFKLLSATRINETSIGFNSIPEACSVVKGNAELLRVFLSRRRFCDSHISEALGVAFEQDLRETQEALIGVIYSCCNVNVFRDCAVTAIVYNKPETLKIILQTPIARVTTLTEMPLFNICSVLKRTECLNMLKNSRFDKALSDEFYPVDVFINFAKTHYACFGEEILARLRGETRIKQTVDAPFKKGLSRLQLCVPHRRLTVFLKPNIRLGEMKVLLGLDADVDATDDQGDTVLSNLLDFKPI